MRPPACTQLLWEIKIIAISCHVVNVCFPLKHTQRILSIKEQVIKFVCFHYQFLPFYCWTYRKLQPSPSTDSQYILSHFNSQYSGQKKFLLSLSNRHQSLRTNAIQTCIIIVPLVKPGLWRIYYCSALIPRKGHQLNKQFMDRRMNYLMAPSKYYKK